MTAMEIHDAIGDGMVIVLTPFAIAAALVAVFAVGVKVFSLLYYGIDKRDLDVIGSHLLSADGKKWDFSKENHSDKARVQRDIRPESDPDVWDGVEYDDDGRKYEIVPAQGETRPARSDMELEIMDAEIIPE